MDYVTQWGRQREDWETDKSAFVAASPKDRQQFAEAALSKLSDAEFQTIVDVVGHPSKSSSSLVAVNPLRGDFTIIESGKRVVYSF